jgi:hypothetical protein
MESMRIANSVESASADPWWSNSDLKEERDEREGRKRVRRREVN